MLRAQTFAPCRPGSPASAFFQEQSLGAGAPCSLPQALMPSSETQQLLPSPTPPSLGSSLVLPRLSPCLGHGHTHQPRPCPIHLLQWFLLDVNYIQAVRRHYIKVQPLAAPSPSVGRSAFGVCSRTRSSELSLSTQLASGCVLPARVHLRAAQCGSL